MDKKEEIIKYLKKNGKTAFSIIGRNLKIHHYEIKLLVKELESENKIKLTEEGNGTYAEVIL